MTSLCVKDECWQRKKSLRNENKKYFTVKLLLYLLLTDVGGPPKWSSSLSAGYRSLTSRLISSCGFDDVATLQHPRLLETQSHFTG